MKIGDEVKLKYIPDDLRYDVGLGDVGKIVGVDNKIYNFRKGIDGVLVDDLPPRKKEYNIAVKWYDNEPAMTHKPEELEIVKEN